MYISENIHYLPKEVSFFSHAAFFELMRRTSFFLRNRAQFPPYHYRTDTFRTLFNLKDCCSDLKTHGSCCQSSCQKITSSLFAYQHSDETTHKTVWSQLQKSSSSIRLQEKIFLFFFSTAPFIFFFVVSRLSSNTLRKRPGSRGGRHH